MNVYVNEQFPYLDFMDIRPGDRVVLKPNLVKEGKETDKNEWKCVVTSPELIRYVANYVCEKLGGKAEGFCLLDSQSFQSVMGTVHSL